MRRNGYFTADYRFNSLIQMKEIIMNALINSLFLSYYHYFC